MLQYIKIIWRFKINNILPTKIFNEIFAYKEVIPNPSFLVSILEKSKTKPRNNKSYFSEWKGWYGFGDQISFGWSPYKTLEEVINEDCDIYNLDLSDDEDEEEYVAKVISSVFYYITKDYLARTKMIPLNWRSMGIAICRYEVIETEELGMAYHTDYVLSKEDEPGYKFGITCTMYLNDDYEGGEICFLNTDTTQVVQYTPHAGDVVFFPSGEPYYHGVNKILKGQKYIVRVFWGYDYLGSEQWHENEKKYGKEEWAKMENERIKKHFHEGTYHKEVVWDEKELMNEKYIIGEKPTVTPYLSKYPLIKMGKEK